MSRFCLVLRHIELTADPTYCELPTRVPQKRSGDRPGTIPGVGNPPPLLLPHRRRSATPEMRTLPVLASAGENVVLAAPADRCTPPQREQTLGRKRRTPLGPWADPAVKQTRLNLPSPCQRRLFQGPNEALGRGRPTGTAQPASSQSRYPVPAPRFPSYPLALSISGFPPPSRHRPRTRPTSRQDPREGQMTD